MKLTTKGRYAVTALLDVALYQHQGPITISQMAERNGISPAYLERLTLQMRQKGLLKSVRGAKGGYLLAKAPEQINVADIMASVDENLDATRCQGKSNCLEGQRCLTHELWNSLNDKIYHFLQGVNLATLAEPYRRVHSPAMPLAIIRSVEHV